MKIVVMDHPLIIDTEFDFRIDSSGKDPDAYSPTLRRYHKYLWSKCLPCGAQFDLVDTTPGVYLHHRSDVGEFFLSSDSVMQTFTRWVSMKSLVEQLPDEDQAAFMTMSYTIGGMMVFPANKVDGKQTINGARGFTSRIADRMDLTLECIKQLYLGEKSPLDATLARYWDFFALFSDFCGYVDFFLLQDLVTEDYSAIRYFLPSNECREPSVSKDLDSYVEYRRLSNEFIKARNRRIREETAQERTDQ
jgi:hypothetical protein